MSYSMTAVMGKSQIPMIDKNLKSFILSILSSQI